MEPILTIDNLNSFGGNMLRQGDKSQLKYRLRDVGNKNLGISGKSCEITMYGRNYTTVVYETTTTVSSDNTVSFTIDKVLPKGTFYLEFIVGDYIFPTDHREFFEITPSGKGVESNIIEIVGVDALVSKAIDLINKDPNLIIDEDKLVSDIISNTGIGSIEEYYQQFNDVITDLSEEKDYHSLPEISAARGGHDTLGQRLDETTAQLAHKVGGGKKAELEDLSSTVLSAIEGGEETSFNLLSEPQKQSVDLSKISNDVFGLVGATKAIVQPFEGYPNQYFIDFTYDASTYDITTQESFGSFKFITIDPNIESIALRLYSATSTTGYRQYGKSIPISVESGRIYEVSHNHLFGDDYDFVKVVVEVKTTDGSVPVTFFVSDVFAKIDNENLAYVTTKSFGNQQTATTEKTDYLPFALANKQDVSKLESDLTTINNDIQLLDDKIGAVQGESTKPPLKLYKLPVNANGERLFNATSFTQDNLTTFNGKQYAVYWNADKKPTIAKRTLPNGEWETFDLSTLVGNPLYSPVPNNGHNNLVVAVDKNSFIHVTGNSHASALKYIRSANPEDITSWESIPMTGISESKVTYPQFVKRKDGDLLFFYRDGESSSGNISVNHYNAGTKTWSKFLNPLIDGVATDENAYLNHIAVGKDGSIQISGCFRGSGNADTNNDIFYMKSLDGGVTWKKSDGTNYTLPVTHSTVEIVVDTPDTGSGLLNQNGMEIDEDGNPHITYFKYDNDGYTNIYHLYHDGNTWIEKQITHFKRTQSTDVNAWAGRISRPSIFTVGKRVFIIYRVNYDGKQGTLRMVEVTPGKTVIDFSILNMDLYNYEATFDTQALYSRNELHLLVIPSHSMSSVYNLTDSFSNQFAGVLSIDLNQIDKVKNGEVFLPEHKLLRSFVVDSKTDLTGTAGEITLPYGVIPFVDRTDSLLFARLTYRAKRGYGTTLTLGIKSYAGGTTNIRGTIPVNKDYFAQGETPIVLIQSVFASTGGWITPYGGFELVEGTTQGTATIEGLSIDVFELVY